MTKYLISPFYWQEVLGKQLNLHHIHTWFVLLSEKAGFQQLVVTPKRQQNGQSEGNYTQLANYFLLKLINEINKKLCN